MKISLIAAIGKNRELGRDNQLLFDIPEDMKFFRETTRGYPVIMGRKTYESIGRPLPNRTNIVISRNSKFLIPNSDVKVVTSIEEAIEYAKEENKDQIFIIGGEQIYKLALPFVDRLYLTVVDSTVTDADAFFPDYSEFSKVISKRKSRNENYSYEFLTLTK